MIVVTVACLLAAGIHLHDRFRAERGGPFSRQEPAQIEGQVAATFAGHFREIERHPGHGRILNLLIRGVLLDGLLDGHAVPFDGTELIDRVLVYGHALGFDRHFDFPPGAWTDGLFGQGDRQMTEGISHLIDHLAKLGVGARRHFNLGPLGKAAVGRGAGAGQALEPREHGFHELCHLGIGIRLSGGFGVAYRQIVENTAVGRDALDGRVHRHPDGRQFHRLAGHTGDLDVHGNFHCQVQGLLVSGLRMQAQDLAGFGPGIEQLCLEPRVGGRGLGLRLRLLRRTGGAGGGRLGGLLGEGRDLSGQVVIPIGDRVGIPSRVLVLEAPQDGLSFAVFGQGRPGLAAGVQRIGLLDEHVHALILVLRVFGSSRPQGHQQDQEDQAREPFKCFRPRS